MLGVRLSRSVPSRLIVTTSPNGGGSADVSSGWEAVFVKNREGISGDTTIKMISITSRTSIRDVTLMLGLAELSLSPGRAFVRIRCVLLSCELDTPKTARFQIDHFERLSAGSNSSGKNRPLIFSPDGIGGTPWRREVSEAERTPSRNTLITAPRRGRSLRFSNEPCTISG